MNNYDKLTIEVSDFGFGFPDYELHFDASLGIPGRTRLLVSEPRGGKTTLLGCIAHDNPRVLFIEANLQGASKFVSLEDDLRRFHDKDDWRALQQRVFGTESAVWCGKHDILVGILVRIYRDLAHNGLVILDMPENFMSYEEISLFTIGLRYLLEERSAFALVATQSSIIVQETPSRFITAIGREDGTISLERPCFETFGESLENIDLYLFDRLPALNQWSAIMREFAEEGLSNEEILRRFDSEELPLLAQSYLERQRINYREWDQEKFEQTIEDLNAIE